jgi:hypothetical protein
MGLASMSELEDLDVVGLVIYRVDDSVGTPA